MISGNTIDGPNSILEQLDITQPPRHWWGVRLIKTPITSIPVALRAWTRMAEKLDLGYLPVALRNVVEDRSLDMFSRYMSENGVRYFLTNLHDKVNQVNLGRASYNQYVLDPDKNEYVRQISPKISMLFSQDPDTKNPQVYYIALMYQNAEIKDALRVFFDLTVTQTYKVYPGKAYSRTLEDVDYRCRLNVDRVIDLEHDSKSSYKTLRASYPEITEFISSVSHLYGIPAGGGLLVDDTDFHEEPSDGLWDKVKEGHYSPPKISETSEGVTMSKDKVFCPNCGRDALIRNDLFETYPVSFDVTCMECDHGYSVDRVEGGPDQIYDDNGLVQPEQFAPRIGPER